MAGLRKLCKMYGRMEINGVMWVWDYAKDEPFLEKEMTKEDFALSERAKYSQFLKRPK